MVNVYRERRTWGKYSERKACIRRETDINRGRKKNRKEERKKTERERERERRGRQKIQFTPKKNPAACEGRPLLGKLISSAHVALCALPNNTFSGNRSAFRNDTQLHSASDTAASSTLSSLFQIARRF